MARNKNDLVGHAVYLELERGDARAQVMLIPAGVTVTGTNTPPAIYYRKVTPTAPRAYWKSTTAAVAIPRDAEGEPTTIDDASAAHKLRDQLLSFVEPVLNGYIARGWTAPHAPLVIEASREDLDPIKDSSTPYKLLYRIQKARVAAGYPADVITAA